jgi:hypothetical protein
LCILQHPFEANLISIFPLYKKRRIVLTSEAVTVTEGVTAPGIWLLSDKVVAVSGRLSPFVVGVGGGPFPVEGLGGVALPEIPADWCSGERPLFEGDAGDGGISPRRPRPGPPLPFESGRLSGDADLK